MPLNSSIQTHETWEPHAEKYMTLAWAGRSSAPRRHDSRGLRSKARLSSDGVEGRLMTDVASLGVWPLGAFAWCVRSAHTAPFRTRR